MKPLQSLLLSAAALLLSATESYAKEIAITFDDAPRGDTVYLTGTKRTEMLLASLKKANVPPATFFVTTGHIKDPAAPRVHAYVEAGHYIANHSHTHTSASATTPQLYLADIALAHEKIKDIPTFIPYFRFPYLNEGKLAHIRDPIRAGLAKQGYTNGYVTVDNFDWYMDSVFQKMVQADKQLDMEKLGELYVSSLLESVAHYDALAVKVLNRSPKHVLLLHENDLAALYIDELIAGLRKKGWTIITAPDAYTDPIASAEITTLHSGQGRIGELAVQAGIAEANIKFKAEQTEYLDALLRQAIAQPPI